MKNDKQPRSTLKIIKNQVSFVYPKVTSDMIFEDNDPSINISSRIRGQENVKMDYVET